VKKPLIVTCKKLDVTIIALLPLFFLVLGLRFKYINQAIKDLDKKRITIELILFVLTGSLVSLLIYLIQLT